MKYWYKLKTKFYQIKSDLARKLAPDLFSVYETAFKNALEITKMRKINQTLTYQKVCFCRCRSKKHKIKYYIGKENE